MPSDLLRAIEPDMIRCPEGSLVGHSACYCGIEAQVIEGRENPHSITAFCMGEYTQCPTKQREAEAAWNDEPTLSAQVRQADAKRATTRAKKQAAQDRRLLAMELLHSDTEQGRKFRGRLRNVLDGKTAGLMDAIDGQR